MSKKVFYDDDARERVLGGAKALYDAVKVTYGPKGRNVVIEKAYGGPTVTHDGVTVAENIDLPADSDETLGYKVGAELIKHPAPPLQLTAKRTPEGVRPRLSLAGLGPASRNVIRSGSCLLS